MAKTKRILTTTIFFILLLFSNILAYAEDIYPKNLDQYILKPKLIGKATLSIFKIEFYDISLWSSSKDFSYEQPFAIHIKYKKNFSKKSLVARSIKEMKKNNNINSNQEAFYKNQLDQVFEDIKKGDNKTAIYLPNKKLTIYHNYKLVGDIFDQRLARLFVDIWLDKNSSFPNLTAQLLAKSE